MKRLQNSFRRLALLCAVLCLFGALLSVQGLAADLTVEGGSSYDVYLSVTATNGRSSSNGSCSLTGNVMTITATGYTYISGRKTTTTVTVTSSYPGTMTIPYTCTGNPTISVSNNGVNSGGVITLNGAGASFTVSLQSPTGNNTNTATFTFGTIGYSELTPYVTFQRPTNGSYTVSYDCSQEVQPYSTFHYSNARTYDLYATPDAGYEFLAWMDDTGAVLSEQPEFYYRAASDTTISAVFIPAGCARFYVMGNPSKLYYYLDEASSAAGSNGVIIAKTDGKICFSGDQTSFTLPGDQTLIVPHSAGATSINSSSNDHPYACETLVLASVKRSTLADPGTNAYITLTLPAGHTLTVNGKLAVGGTMNGAGGIVSEWLEENSDTTQQVYHSNICLENSARLAVNGKLSSCGFIYGEGTVEANSGAEVYVPFSILDYRGGGFVVGAAGQSQGYGITPVTSESSLSPLAHYTANAIQARQQIADNAKVIGYVDLFTTGILGGHHCDNATLIGPSDALLILGTGSSATITYDGSVYAESYPAIGKTKIVVDGNASFGCLTLTVSVGTNISVTTNGVNFPLPYNFEIELASGCFDLSHSLSIFPGAKVTVGEQATLEVNSSLTVYDGLHDYSTAGSESTDYKFFHFDFFSDTNIEISDVYNASTNPNGTWMYQPSSLPYPNTAELQKSSFGGSGAADLIVNGTMELKSGATFGGIVQTAASDATVIVEPGVTLSTSTQVGLIGTYRALIKGFSFVGATTRTLTGQILDTGTGAKTDMAAGKTYHSSTGSDRVDSYTYDVYYAYEPSSGNSQEKKTSKQITEPVNMVLQGSWYNYTVLIHVVDEEGTEYDTIEMKFAHGASVAGMGYYSDLSLQTEVTTIQNGNDLYYRGEPEVKVVSSADGSETNYLKVRAAVQAAGSSGDRVVLLRDLEGFDSSVIAGQGQDLIFDLNGHRLSYKGTPFFAAAGGTLTVDLNGGTLTNTVDGVSYHCAPFAVTAGGTLTVLLNGGSIAVDAGDERVHTGAVNYGSMTVDLGSSGGSWSYTTGLTAGSAAYKGSAALINEGTMTITGSANAELSGKITSDALSTASGVDGAAVVRNGAGGSLTLSGGRLEHVNTTSGDNSYGLLNLGTVLSVTNTKITVLNGAAVRNYSLIETIGAGNYFQAPKQTLYNVGTITTIDSKIESDSATLTRIISTNGAALYNYYQSDIGAGAIGTIKNVYIEASENQGIYNSGSDNYHPVIDEIGAGTEVYSKTGTNRPAILNSASSIIREISGGIYRSNSSYAIGNLNTSEPIELSGGDFRQANSYGLFFENGGNNITYAANKALSVLTRTPPDAVVIDVTVGGFSYVTDVYTVTFVDPEGYMDPAPAPVPVEDGQCVTKPDNTPESADFLNGWVYEWQLNGEAYDFASPVTQGLTLTLVYHQIDMARVIWADGSDPTSYQNVQAALNAAIHAGDRIVLLADQPNCNFTVTGLSGGRVFDLNGKTVTSENTIVSVGADTGLTLELNGGTLDRQTGATASADTFQSAAAVDNEGTLTVTGPGTVRMDGLSTGTRAATMSAAIRNGGSLTLEGGVTVRGVPRPDASTSRAFLVGVANHDQGEIQTVSDGKYEGLIAGIFNNAKVDGIQGGTFIAQSGSGAGYYSSSNNYSTHITDGLFYCRSNNIRDRAIYNWSATSIITYDNGFTLSKSPNSDGYYYITAYYDVSFQDRGETVAAFTEVELGSGLAEPVVSAEGWTLEGWYRTPDFAENGKWSFSTDTVTADTVLYAKWTCAVSFDLQGHGTGAQPETQTVLYGACAGQPDAPAVGDAVTENDGTYRFDGWYQDQSCTAAFDFTTAVSGNASAWAKWTPVYSVTFRDEDGTELQSGWAASGETPIYTGETPEKAATAQYSYTFIGWSPAIAAVSEDATYTAVYSSTVREYTITFANEDGTELQKVPTAYGAMPAYTGATPEKAATAQYSYTFDHWTPEITSVTGDATYTAVYSSTVNEYTITFVNADGTVLQSGLTAYGETPEYSGATPEKAVEEPYTYAFSGWSPAISAVTGDTTYTAQFTATANEAKIGTAYYTTLTDAIDAAQNGDTVTLLADVTGQYTIGEGKRLTLDLNGYTVANDVQVIAQGGVITNKGELTLNLSGGVVKYQTGATAASDDYKGKAAVDNYGGLTVNGPGTVMADPLESSYKAADLCAAIRNCGALTMQNGVTVRAVPSNAADGYLIGVVNYSPGTIAEIKDGVYDGYIVGVFNNATIQKITGGTFIARSSSGWAYFTNQETTLTGGYYKNTVKAGPEKAVYRYTDIANIRYETANHTLSKSPNAEGYYYITAYYDVSFDMQSHGTQIDPVTDVEVNSKVNAPAAPTETGYSFGGWYKDADCTVEWDFDADLLTADTTLYAKWTINTYTITWSVNGVETAETLPYGTVPNPADPTRAADEQYTYTFSGWEPAIAPVTGDATYTAKFTGTPNVAKIGSAYYTTLTEAISAAQTGDTVTLLSDITGNYTIAAGKSLTLDLNHHSITSDVGNVLTNNGDLVLELNGGKVDFHTGASVGSEAYQGKAAIVNSGTMTVQDTAGGGMVTTDAAVSNVSRNSLYYYISALLNTRGTLTVTGGKFVATETVNDRSQGVFIRGGEVALISGGEFEGRDYGLVANANGKIVAITGGTFTGAGQSGCGLYNYSTSSNKGAAQVSGGYFKGSSRENAIYELTNTYSYAFPSGCVLSDTTTTAPNGQSGYYYVYKTVTVTYQQRVNGELVTVAEDTIPAGELRALKTVAELEELGFSVPEGYVFQQWSGSNDRTYEDGELSRFHESVTLTAQWKPEEGNSNVEAPVTVNWYDGISGALLRTDYLESLEELSQPTVRTHEGYAFTGWRVELNNETLTTVSPSPITRDVMVSTITIAMKNMSDSETFDVYAEYSDKADVEVTIQYQLGDAPACAITAADAFIKGVPESVTDGVLTVKAGKLVHLIAATEYQAGDVTYVFDHWTYGAQSIQNRDILVRPTEALTLTAVYVEGSGEPVEPEIICYISDLFSELVNGKTKIGATMSFSVPDDGNYTVLMAGLFYSRNPEDFANGTATYKGFVPDHNAGDYTHRLSSKSNTYNFYFQGYIKYTFEGEEIEVFSEIVGPYDWIDPTLPGEDGNRATEPEALEQTQAVQGQEESEQMAAEIGQSAAENQDETAAAIPEAQQSTEPTVEALSEATETLSPGMERADAGSE